MLQPVNMHPWAHAAFHPCLFYTHIKLKRALATALLFLGFDSHFLSYIELQRRNYSPASVPDNLFKSCSVSL